MTDSTVYEIWDTDTFNLLGAYIGKDRVEQVAIMFTDRGRRVRTVDTGLTKEEYNQDKKGVLP